MGSGVGFAFMNAAEPFIDVQKPLPGSHMETTWMNYSQSSAQEGLVHLSVRLSFGLFLSPCFLTGRVVESLYLISQPCGQQSSALSKGGDVLSNHRPVLFC